MPPLGHVRCATRAKGPPSPEGTSLAGPDREVSRPSLTPRAVPASPQRLAVYPRRDEAIVARGKGGEDETGVGEWGWVCPMLKNVIGC